MSRLLVLSLLLSLAILVRADTSGRHDNASAMARLAKAKAKETFTFGVIGDTQLTNELLKKHILTDLKNLGVDFIVQVGDLIKGYTNDTTELLKQWSLHDATLETLGDLPILLVPGNHDISPNYPAGLTLFKRLRGEPYSDFTYQGCAFILLCTDFPEREGLSDAEWKWLKETLKKNKAARRTFVFMHRPLMKEGGGDYGDSLHPLFAATGVDYVFYGHEHNLEYETRDGVVYMETVASAKSIVGEKAGGFPHSLFLTVTPDTVRVAVIRAGAVLAADTVRADFSDMTSLVISGNAAAISPITIDDRKPSVTAFAMTAKNISRKPARLTYRWKADPSSCPVAPASGDTLLPPASTASLPFTLKCTAAAGNAFSDPYADLRFLLTTQQGDTLSVATEVTARFLLNPANYSLKKKMDRPILLAGDSAAFPILKILSHLGLTAGKHFRVVTQFDSLSGLLRRSPDALLLLWGKFLSDPPSRAWFDANAATLRDFVKNGGRLIAVLPARRNQAPAEAFGLKVKTFGKNEGDSVWVVNFDTTAATAIGVSGRRLSTQKTETYFFLGYYTTADAPDARVVSKGTEGWPVGIYLERDRGKAFFTTANLAAESVLEQSDVQRFWYDLLSEFGGE